MSNELKEKIFNEKKNEAVVHEVLLWFLASRRRGTHSAKTRAEVSGGGIKPWKQKGTGRARAGSNRSPLWRKGGVIFPPKPRDYSFSMPVKVRKLGLRVALSELNRDGQIKIVDACKLAQPKTKAGAKFLKELEVKGKVLILTAERDKEFERGVRNLEGVKVLPAKDLNIYDLLNAAWLVIEKPAIAQLEERLS